MYKGHLCPLRSRLKLCEAIAPVSKIPRSLPFFSLCPEGHHKHTQIVPVPPLLQCTQTPQGHHDCRLWFQVPLRWTCLLRTGQHLIAGTLPGAKKLLLRNWTVYCVHNLHVRNSGAVIHSWAIELSMTTLQFQSETNRIQEFTFFTVPGICLPSHPATCNF